MRYLIVGSGPAGISAAEEIRKGDPEGPITLMTAEARPASSPVMLTYWVSGRYPTERLSFRDMGSWAGEHRVELRCGERAAAVDVQRQAVTLSDGEVLHYDRLLVATGATPVIPPIPGIAAKGVYPFRTLADAEGILTSRPVEDLAIMGGGFIGIKLACHLQERGISVAVFEKEPRLASRIFDQRASDIVREHLRGHGLTVETGTGIAEIIIARRVGIRGASGGRQAVPSPDSRRCGGGAAEHRAPGCRARHNAGRDPGERTDGDPPPPRVRCGRCRIDAGFAHRRPLQ